MIEHWDKFTREVVESSPLEMIRSPHSPAHPAQVSMGRDGLQRSFPISSALGDSVV